MLNIADTISAISRDKLRGLEPSCALCAIPARHRRGDAVLSAPKTPVACSDGTTGPAALVCSVMALGTWLRAMSAVSTVAEATKYFRSANAPVDQTPAGTDPVGPLEARLASVLVAAIREAFDRDRARFDLEQDFHDAEAVRRERALRLEWIRQTGTRGVTHATHLALLSIAVWVASVAVAGWLSPLANSTKIVLGLGWVGLSVAVAAAFVTYQQLTTWLAQGVSSADPNGTSAPSSASREPPVSTAQTALPWLFLAGFVTTGLGLVFAL